MYINNNNKVVLLQLNQILNVLLKNNRETVAMRDKEKLHDYRFMPEPNLPPLRLYRDCDLPGLNLDEGQVVNVDDIERSLPQLPQDRRGYLQEKYGLVLEQAITLVVGPSFVLVLFVLLVVLFNSIQNLYSDQI